jgi:hypothetical protein
MDTLTTITNAVISLVIASLPHTWQLIVGFLLGCWFYRRMLVTNPTRLQKLVDTVNNAGKLAQAVVTKVEDAVDDAEAVATKL